MTYDSQRCARAAERIAGRGYGIILVAMCENSETPGIPGHLAGVTDHRKKTVRISLMANPTMDALADTLEHEAHHVDHPEWDCLNRDVLGRGGSWEGPGLSPDDVLAQASLDPDAHPQDAATAGQDPGHAVAPARASTAVSARPVRPWQGGKRPKLTDPQRNTLMELCRGRQRYGPDWYGGRGRGGTLFALEHRRLVTIRDSRLHNLYEARITERGEHWLDEEGITCR